ncbi:regulator of microtubule dynamics protein 3-like, partial [Seriola lalandi dorsalis]|uniref:regulator of microtubule dynamics protein 3-like n=1 Tax=Seriola lalandi dorsalis TaxID=1841481 RepID=UPI000C6FBE6F
MNTPLGRNGFIGLAVGATAGLGLIAFIIYREISKRKSQRLVLEARPAARLFDGADGAALLREALDAQEAEAQQQALAAVEAVVQGLSPEQQLELRNQLDQVLSCVASLRSEVAELRGGLQDIALQIIQDVKKGVEDSQRLRRRRHVVHRERTDSTSSSSIYFTASQGMASAYDETSEGGYSTAYAESDYTDRDTDKEEGAQQPEQESEEEEDRSCATVLTLRQEDSQEEEVEEDRELEEEEEEEEKDEDNDEGRLQLVTEVPSGELALLLAQSDILHTGDASLKAEGFRLLLDNRAEVSDLDHMTLSSTQEHLDRAIALRDDDPMCFYLLGRWCYEVATLDWLEKKAAAALYQSPPSSTLHDALENFLKAEELSPGFSKTVRLYIAKCHQELGNISEATNWTELALKMSTNTNDVRAHVTLPPEILST